MNNHRIPHRVVSSQSSPSSGIVYWVERKEMLLNGYFNDDVQYIWSKVDDTTYTCEEKAILKAKSLYALSDYPKTKVIKEWG